MSNSGMGVTRQVLMYQVSLTLGGHEEDFDIRMIVEEILTTYGAVDIDEIPSEECTAIVLKHALTAGPESQ